MIPDDFISSFKEIIRILNDNGVSFYITGGLVSSFYGEPRFTQDIDIVIDVDLDDNKRKSFFDSITKGHLISESSYKKAFCPGGMFQIINEHFIVKTDFHVGEMVAGAKSRVVEIEILEDVVVPALSLEDAIACKLVWVKMGSHKSRNDIKAMLRNPKLNKSLLATIIEQNNLSEVLAEIE